MTVLTHIPPRAVICIFFASITASSASVRASQPDLVFTLSAATTSVEIRLDVEIDGRPFDRFLRPRFEALFGHLDVDNNQKLDADELNAAPSAGWLRRAAWGYLPANHSDPVVLQEADRDGDESISCAELQAWYAKHGVGSITVLAARSHMTPVLTAALWRHLDVDGDRWLSRTEIAAAADSLRKLDEDDDERISSREISSSVTQPYPWATKRLENRTLEIAPRTDPHTTLQLPILAKLSFEQAAVQLTKNADESAGPDGRVIDTLAHANGIVFTLGDSPCSLVAARGSSQRWAKHLDSSAKSHLQDADRNNDQSVTVEEAATAANRTVLALFHFADRDRNGRVASEDWATALDILRGITEANVHMAVLIHDQALFEALDANRDGFLSRPELRAAASIVRPTRRDDLPTVVTVILSFGRPTFPLAIANRNPPTWFAAMDRNDDGIVTRFEFIGESRTFDRLDQNQNGQLSHHEAEH